MKRPGQPSEIGPAYVYLASEESSYMSGQTMHLNGGVILNT
jgi:NAD(P)-dependent dehydrogenase (short-subunit alcohol dehydrogenase family)